MEGENMFYKTKLCSLWLSNHGDCPFNENCKFAHGEAEKRKVPLMCRYPRSICPRGDECVFLHTEAEAEALRNLPAQPPQSHQDQAPPPPPLFLPVRTALPTAPVWVPYYPAYVFCPVLDSVPRQPQASAPHCPPFFRAPGGPPAQPRLRASGHLVRPHIPAPAGPGPSVNIHAAGLEGIDVDSMANFGTASHPQ